MKRAFAIIAGLTVLAIAPAAAAMPGHTSTTRHEHRQVQKVRSATAKFHNIARAEAAGYVPFTDIHGVSCIAERGMGGMGVHYVNPTLIADPKLDRTAPEALVYAPDRDGTLRLAALEYIVDKSAWDAGHSGRPRLFGGHRFDLTKAPNRFGLDTFYSQHVWAWKPNPAGLLAMWNPTVHCGRA